MSGLGVIFYNRFVLKSKISKIKSGLKSRSKSPCHKTEQHKNYYLLERENLERKFEQRAKEIQVEVLNSLEDIEVQLGQQKEQLERTLAKNTTHHYHHQHFGRNSVQQIIIQQKQERARRSRRSSAGHYYPASTFQSVNFNQDNFRSRNPNVCETDV